jgi:hypothetical protein
MHRGRRLLLVTGLLAGCSSAGPAQPRATAAPPALVERAMAEAVPDAAGRCRDVARQELQAGHHLSDVEVDGCASIREQVGQRLIRQAPGQPFGVVDHRHVDLVRVRLRLSVARRCRDWPLRRPESSSLRPRDLASTRCRLRPYHGPLTVAVVSSSASVELDQLELHTDRDGYVELVLADVDAALRALGAGSLEDYTRLEFGRAAWAGAIELGRWRAVSAEYHYRWVERGRGSPALFLHRHGDRSRGDDAHILALEARLARQEHDLALVEEGQLSPRAFIERHVWSPFRRIVERMLTDVTAPP